MATLSDDGLWQVEAPEPGVGILGWAVYHQASEECRTLEQEVSGDRLYARCSCGAVLEAEREA